MAGNPKTLVILRNRGNFEFFFEDEEDRYWRVRDYPGEPGWFLVEEDVDGYYVSEFHDKYKNAGVRNRRELLCRLIEDPEATLEGLFGEKFQIEKVVVR